MLFLYGILKYRAGTLHIFCGRMGRIFLILDVIEVQCIVYSNFFCNKIYPKSREIEAFEQNIYT